MKKISVMILVIILVTALGLLSAGPLYGLSLRCIMDDGYGDEDNTDGGGRILDTGDYMFVGTSNDSGTLIYRSDDDGESWECISQNGINGTAANCTTCTLTWFNGKLYVGTWQLTGTAQLFRANADAADPDDIVWETISNNGFGNSKNTGFTNGIVHSDGYIYVGCYNLAEGSEVWRSSSGNAGTWSMVITKSWGRSDNSDTTCFYVYNGYLYAGTEMVRGSAFRWKGTALFRTAGGSAPISWTQVNPNGYGEKANNNTGAITYFNGYLYAGTWNGWGMQVWRTAMSGSPPWSWSKVVTGGSGKLGNCLCQGLSVLGNNIYYGSVGDVFGTPERGRFYTSSNGTTWTEITGSGFIEDPVAGIIWMISANSKIYMSLYAPTGTGELWVYE